MNKAFYLLLLLLLPLATHADECGSDSETKEGNVNKVLALKYKIIAVASILVAGAIGVSLPIVGKIFPSLSPENDFFFAVKAFAAGVILATGCVHVLPDAFDNLTSPCLQGENPWPWGKFSFTGLGIMTAASATMLLEQVASILFKRMHFGGGGKAKAVTDHDHEEMAGEHEGHVHVHTHATHGHAHGAAACGGDDAQLLRHKVISQVLEIGIVVHSVIIGISLGASENPKTIKPLIAALSFHQLFEGMGLGGCISQAKLKATSVTIMSIFFSLTTPFGIAIGFAISNSYNENSPTALIVEGLFNAASAGILIYMALVDLIEADFKSARVLNNLKLLFTCDVTLLLGMGCMSVLAIWA